MNQISGVDQILPVQPLSPSSAGRASDTGDFCQLLETAIARVEASGAESTRAVDKFLSGESEDLHSVALAGQKAALQFEMFLQVRNKMVQAYQEVMRMQL
jgi:flagellar hook-basal body complex protein FliE